MLPNFVSDPDCEQADQYDQLANTESNRKVSCRFALLRIYHPTFLNVFACVLRDEANVGRSRLLPSISLRERRSLLVDARPDKAPQEHRSPVSVTQTNWTAPL